MSLLEAELCDERQWSRVGDGYEVTKKQRSLDPAKFPTIPFAAMEAIPQDGTYLPDFTMKAPAAIASGIYFERGDILVGKITPSFENGKQALVLDLPAPFGYATTEVIPLHPRSVRHDPRLLFFYLLHPDIRHYIAERMEGSTGRKRVPESVLLDLPIPLIDPEEQTAIADALEVIQRASAAEANCEELVQDLKRAAMRHLFTRGLRSERQQEDESDPIPEGWKASTVGSHFRVVSGGTPSRDNAEYWTGGTIPWVKTTEVNYGVIEKTTEFITASGLANSAAKMLPIGTLLLAMYGQGVTRGRVAVLGIEAACNQACAAINACDEEVSPSYLFHFLTYRYEAIRKMAHGGQQQNLNLEIVRDLPLVFPTDHHEQREIVAVLDVIDQKIRLHKRKRAVAEKLFNSLLHKLMTGDIRAADLDLIALAHAPLKEVAA